jgi:hypothetical protein
MAADDRLLSALILAITAMLGWNVVRAPDRSDQPDQTLPLPTDGVEVRVRVIAHAIAIAEGYYAGGEHDGRSLPFRLNNPGALKKPALGASLLPTWRDSGLVVFPTRAMGWAALRHQVRSMLTGQSAIYEPSDTLLLVAEKYADGDVNWAANVASLLHVPPTMTLEDLVADR